MIINETWIVKNKITTSIDLDPEDYLYCETEDEVYDAIWEEMACNAELIHNVDEWIEPIDNNFEDFIFVWKELKFKNNEN